MSVVQVVDVIAVLDDLVPASLTLLVLVLVLVHLVFRIGHGGLRECWYDSMRASAAGDDACHRHDAQTRPGSATDLTTMTFLAFGHASPAYRHRATPRAPRPRHSLLSSTFPEVGPRSRPKPA